MNASQELSCLADATVDVLTRLREKRIQEPIQKIRQSCEEVGRAWSGSNIGYHAFVYCKNFRPKQPNIQFSSEWGIGDHWPTHQSADCWEIMDKQAVMDSILRRSNVSDIDGIEQRLGSMREQFDQIKEHVTSVLSVAIANMSDAFLQKKLKEIEQLEAPTPISIAIELLPRGKIWTRDALAMSQGLQIAPHQQITSLPMSAVALESVFDRLEKASRISASHLKRIAELNQKHEEAGMTIFIGHGASPVWRELKEFLGERLKLKVEEFNSVSPAGIPTVTRLTQMLDAAAFAFVIMTAEDQTSEGKLNARLNVIHEVGLFQGRLGFNKAIVLLEESCEEFSNIHGLGQIRFLRGNISSKFEEIRQVLEREKLMLPYRR